MKIIKDLQTISIWIILILGLLVSNSANCQFLNDDASWTVELRTFGGEPQISYSDISVFKDTVINEKVYKIFNYLSITSAL